MTLLERTVVTSPDERYVHDRNKLTDALSMAFHIDNPLILDAFRKVERHKFIPETLISLVDPYADEAIPINNNTLSISQPSLMAQMFDQLDLQRGDSILEVGTGTGYEAALLKEIVGWEGTVFSVESREGYIPDTRALLERLGYDIAIFHKNGWDGLSEHAPFDKIILSAAPPDFPPALITQLHEGGKIIGPLGRCRPQILTLGEKSKKGFTKKEVLKVDFVFMENPDPIVVI